MEEGDEDLWDVLITLSIENPSKYMSHMHMHVYFWNIPLYGIFLFI